MPLSPYKMSPPTNILCWCGTFVQLVNQTDLLLLTTVHYLHYIHYIILQYVTFQGWIHLPGFADFTTLEERGKQGSLGVLV